ncbi:MAG TPA: MgtC/SapB family protein [Phycisphaerae bacterium]|nr:MgtC/SapB family protein [Phycisphaerae bacterium]
MDAMTGQIVLFGRLLSWQWEAVLRLGAAAILGGLIGLEREHRGQSAGFRTQLLVALGAGLAMLVSLHFGRIFGGGAATGAIRVDPARVAYGVMGGIGFIGAGAIIRHGFGVRGLTTAATLWCTAALGLACGFGMFFVAAAATVIVLFALLVLNRLDTAIPSQAYKDVVIVLPFTAEDSVGRFQRLLKVRGAKIRDVQYDRDYRENIETITFRVSISSRFRLEELLSMAEGVPEVIRITIR